MSRSRVRFAEDDLTQPPARRPKLEAEQEADGKPYKKKHTLDSDEEDNAEPDERLDVNKVEGQEEATEEYDGNIKIMAFNMKEDMEEGHFDQDGNFIYDKKGEQIKDEWLDNVDWDSIKRRAGKNWHKTDEGEEDSEAVKGVDTLAACSRLLQLLKEKETIGKALRRLNSEKGLSAAEERKRRWAAKKAGTSADDEHAKAVAEMTTLADGLVSLGHMQAYDLDASALQKMIDEAESKSGNRQSAEPLDMFSDLPTSSDQKESQGEPSIDNEVKWHYRLLNNDDAQVHGPFTTAQMTKAVESGALKDGGFVRRVGTDTFYDVKRIDFDLFD